MLQHLQLGRQYLGSPPAAEGRRQQRTVKAVQLSRLRLPKCSWARLREAGRSSRAMGSTEEGEVHQDLTSIKVAGTILNQVLLRRLGSRLRRSLDSPGITVAVDREAAGLRAKTQPRVEEIGLGPLGLLLQETGRFQGTSPRASEGQNRRVPSGGRPCLGWAGTGVREVTGQTVCHRAGICLWPHLRPRQQ